MKTGEINIDEPNYMAEGTADPNLELTAQDKASVTDTPDLTSRISSPSDASYGSHGTNTQINGSFDADGCNKGMQSDGCSLISYQPTVYVSGASVGIGGESRGKPYFYSEGYFQQSIGNGSESLPSNSSKSNKSCTRFVSNNSVRASTYLGKSNTFCSTTKPDGILAHKYWKPPHTQHDGKIRSKMPHLGSDFSAVRPQISCQLQGSFPPFSNQKQKQFLHKGSPSIPPNGTVWNVNDRQKPRDSSSRNEEMAAELTRGPRAFNKSLPLDASNDKEGFGFLVSRDQYNLSDFQTEYAHAKFFVIKSFNEDDIHKCIKYRVWTSTHNGNKKLNSAFHDAEAKVSEADTKCPIFLFFSVNGSGQFVGVAEMVGQVDFNKDMDFWHLDKYNGFFPVRWHIIKDVPSYQLRHIILENNDNKPVTSSRDTQEIGLKQGLGMLKIFKSYPGKKSLLDDFSFYESRERSIRMKKGSKRGNSRHSETYGDHNLQKNVREGERKVDHQLGASRQVTNAKYLIDRTKNLSLNPLPEKHYTWKRASHS